ncbi:SRPBCC family protein [Streptomyces sp. So13.3]|uniref:SRPBCC family protein n=1 Tax=Streptomyces sp. So13.3 TaxID=2136173 RepID=UPI0011065514|nr:MULTISPECIES: SRPBCC family protein [unclassified Streptomyces]
MPRVTTSVIVSRPAAEVFDFLADARNLSLWSSGVAGVDGDAVPPGANAEYRYRYPGRHREHRLVCAGYEPCRHIVFRGQRMWSPLGTQVPEYGFDLLPYGAGTLVRLSVHSSLGAGMALFSPVVAMAWRRDLPVDARKLCEALGGLHAAPRALEAVRTAEPAVPAPEPPFDYAPAARVFQPGVGA